MCWQKFRSVDLAQDGDKRVLNANGEETEAFVDPLRVQYRDILEVCQTSARREYLILPYFLEQATEQLTSNEKHDGKMNFEAAPDSQPYGEMNAGKWFKRVARPMV